MTFNLPVKPSFSFRGFRLRGGDNPDGWGLAFYPDNSVQVFKESKIAIESQLSNFLRDYEQMQSRVFVAHVRKASSGNLSHSNTHPFSRESNGKEYVFAHNGTLRSHKKRLVLERFKPIGETDSEHLFCYLLNCIADRKIDVWNIKDFEWFAAKLKEINNLGKVNCILSDGKFLLCYHDINGYKGLKFVHRQPPYGIAELLDEDYAINLKEEKDHAQKGYVIATKPLTDEKWESFAPGELIVFMDGDLVFSSLERELNFSWVIENQLAGIRGPTGNEDLQFLGQKGIAVLVRLAEKQKACVTTEQVTEAGLEDFYFPVEDFHAASMAQIDKITNFVKTRLSQNKAVAVSCGAGIGRTGMVLTCILISMCNSIEDAKKIMEKANRSICETDAQHQAIVDYAKKIGKF